MDEKDREELLLNTGNGAHVTLLVEDVHVAFEEETEDFRIERIPELVEGFPLCTVMDGTWKKNLAIS